MKLLSAFLGVFLIFQLQRYLYLHFWSRNLSVELNFSDNRAVEGDELVLTETVTNRKLLPLPIIRMKFTASRYLSFLDNHGFEVTDNSYRNDIISVMMYQKLTRSIPFVCTHRGYFTIKEVFLMCHDIFISGKSMATLSSDLWLYVYPGPVDQDKFEIPFRKMLGTVIAKRSLNEDPFEFRGIREYQSYDTLKSINWKASAKTGSLMVNIHDYTASQQVKIFLNLEAETIWKHEDLEEESIRIAAAFAASFIEAGIPVALFTNAPNPSTGDLLQVPVGSSAGHIRTINETLAFIDTSLPFSGFVNTFSGELENAAKNDYLIFISPYQKEDLKQQLMDLAEKKSDFSWIIPFNTRTEITAGEALTPYIIPWEIS